MFHLQVVNGPHRGQEITVHNTSITLGRASHCHLVLAKDTGVSRTHGELSLSGRTVLYTDLLSHNGSRIRKRNGSIYTLSPLFSRCELEPGDLIFVGNTVIELVTAGDSSICFDGDVTLVPASNAAPEATLAASTGGEESATAESLRQFLQLPQFDVTDVTRTKHALSRAYFSVFPQATSIAVVEIRTPRTGTKLTPDHVLESETVVSRRNQVAPNGYSFGVLKESFEKRGIVVMHGPENLPNTESVNHLKLSGCICGPIYDGRKIVGFVQLISNAPVDFGARDHEVFGILTSITSLLLRQSRVASEQVKTRRLASSVRRSPHFLMTSKAFSGQWAALRLRSRVKFQILGKIASGNVFARIWS